ncbi:MAG: cofactor-independent phosphoglycerate mutase, partial [Clostridia bacterium]|nr:cofactor-independent phosphoglycerate mutase [Clostridia bacterium]
MKPEKDVKYIVMLGDGMADLPIDELGGKTPLAYADKPFMNHIANKGINGRVYTVPKSMKPESDTANMCVMGFNPLVYATGRSPLEALSMGIDMKPDETANRVNLVALSDKGEKYEDKIMLDHSSDEIPSEEAKILIESIEDAFGDSIKRFYPGVSYRHCVIWKNCHTFDDYSRPHDIIGKKIGEYLPYKPESKEIRDIMKRSFDILNTHPLNVDRAMRGLKKANSLWFWGPGKKPSLPDFKEKTGLSASVICAVDLIKGIGLCAGMDAPFVFGATGTLDTNYHGKAEAAYNELKKGKDLVYIHVEAPDECGHRGETENKVKSIEYIDREILGYLMNKLDSDKTKYKILLLPDHPTPIAAR